MKKTHLKEGFSVFFTITFLFFLIIALLNIPHHTTEKPEDISKSKTIPTINITLDNANIGNLNSSSKEVSFAVSSLKLTDDNEVTTYNNLEIKGRGNSTWKQPKSSYQIKFQENTELFNFGKAKNWLLLANYLDPSHLKNSTAFYLEKLLNQNYSPEGKFVDLFINNEYIGLYYLTEKIEIKKNRIHLINPDGILVEFEGLHAYLESDCYQTIDANCLVIKDTVNHDEAKTAINIFKEKYEKLYIAAKEKDYETVQALADIDSFAKYYILSELSLNPDAYTSSYYFYMDGDDDRIHIGPGWDFDLAFGFEPTWGMNYGLNYFSPYPTGIQEYFHNDGTLKIKDYNIVRTQDKTESTLMYYLLHIPSFIDEVKSVYTSHIHNKELDIIRHINNEINAIKQSATRNNIHWALDDFTESTEKLKVWLRNRIDYLEYYYSNRPILAPERVTKV